MQKLTRSLLAIGAVVGLAACGDDVTVTQPISTVTGVTVSPSAATIKVGEDVVFSAALQTTGTVTNTAVNWSSANQAIASVDATGKVHGVAPGTTTIRAVSQANTSATGAGAVTVVAPGVQSVSVTPNTATVVASGTINATATVNRDAGVSGAVKWTSSNAAVATVSTAAATSDPITITGVAAGTAVITATSDADATKSASLSVTVTPQPVALNSLTLTPTALTMGPGGTQQVSSIVTNASGATVTYSNNAGDAASGCPGIASATTNAAGVTTVTGVASGACVITVTATGTGTGLQTNSLQATISVTIIAAQISISSITTGMTNTPVPLNNVKNQIEVNLNFQPSGLAVDSVVVRMAQPDGLRRVALQNFGGAVPAAGILTLSVNTANFVKDPSAPSVTIDLLNGPSTVSAQVYPHNSSGGNAVNCTNNPTDPGCASPVAIVLNNTDGWTADITKPSVNAIGANGTTFWGGPTANVTGIIYPVIYTPGRSISNATWTIGSTSGSCPLSATAALASSNGGRTQAGQSVTWGYASNGAAIDCTNYENSTGIAGDRDNAVVATAIDNSANTYPTGAMIPNTVVFNATPDSLRLDYLAPSVNTPSLTRVAPAITGWVNATFSFINFASFDGGVGLRAARDRATSYTSVNCPTVTATDVAMPSGTGADINGAVACPTNFIGGTPGIIASTAPWTVTGSESDRLDNRGFSAATATFGTDYTAPAIRWGTEDLTFADPAPPAGLLATLPAAYGGTVVDPVDSTRFQTAVVKAPGAFGEFRAEFLDERSGFWARGQDSASVSAQSHTLAFAGHLQPNGQCQVGTAPVGATFVTAPGCGFVRIGVGVTPPTQGTFGVRIDGWQPGVRVAVPLPEGYYGYQTYVWDAAGNQSFTLFRSVLINNQSPFATGLGLPALLDSVNFNVNATYADSAEIIAQSLQLDYPALAFGGATLLRYNRTSVGTAFDDHITSPLAINNSPTTGAPYARAIEDVTAAVFPALNIDTTLAGPAGFKPVSATAWSWNNGSTFSAGGPAPGVSATIAIPGLNVQNGARIRSWNYANPTLFVTHFRVIPNVSTSNFFGSTTPLRAQVVAPTNSPNGPFARVDFYRFVDALGASVACGGAGVYWSYLGSVSSSAAIGTDQGTYRSWVYALGTYTNAWNTSAAQTTVAAAECLVAVGVVPPGDGVATAATTMIP